MKHQKCSQCDSMNTVLEVDESISDYEDGDTIHVSIWCKDCMTYSPFQGEDWREYATD